MLLLLAAVAAGCDGTSPTVASPTFTITGRVSDGSQPLPFIAVEILSGPNEGRRVTTSLEGRYALPALSPGEFSLRASATGYQPQTVLVNLDRNTTVDFTLLRRSQPGDEGLVVLSGLVNDVEDNTPIPGADVTVTVGRDRGRGTTTDVDGRFLLDRLRPGPITIEVAAPGYRLVTRDLVAGDVDAVDVALERERVASPDHVSLSGTVSGIPTTGGPAAPVEGAVATLLGGPDAARAALTDGNGQYRLDELARGSATLQVSAPEFETTTRRVTLDTDTTVDVLLGRVASRVFTRGRVVDVLSRANVADVTITGIDVAAAPSDATGRFEIGAVSPSPQPRLVDLASPEVVPRQTYVRVPDTDMEISLIPSTFNMTAFDEMLRDPRLRRWRAAPPLIIERRTLRLANIDAPRGTALDDDMSDQELQSLLTDLRWALPRLTGNTFRSFAGVTERVTTPGKVSTLLTAGSITVVRVENLERTTGTWGWARWLFEPDGTITGGVIMLDLEFDRSSHPYRRSLRAHELGHALGYAHVFTVPSVMHPDARREPTAFDRDATQIAFARQPGNLAPDVEPEPTPMGTVGAATWSPPVR